MKLRRNLPVNTPRGRHHCASAERAATTFIHRRTVIRSITVLPPGVLARLLARKNGLLRRKIQAAISLRQMGLPLLDEYRASSFGTRHR